MKLFADLQSHECRWPTDTANGRFFCAEPIARKSYCAHHIAIAYPPAQQKSYALPAPRKRVAETKSGEIHSVPDEQPETEAVDCVDAMERADG
jgi:hypothetical protein